MLRPEIQGIDLGAFSDHIRSSLILMTEMSDGAVDVLNLDTASVLELTPEKTNYARSSSGLIHRGNVLGDILVIAFVTGDGSGDENTFTRDQVETAPEYPYCIQVIPRSKEVYESEFHITIASSSIHVSDVDIKPNLGSLDLVGIKKYNYENGHTVGKIGILGDNPNRFNKVLDGSSSARSLPLVTSTVWTKPNSLTDSREPIRFGDPHAVFNSQPRTIQVCGFISVKKGLSETHNLLASDLNAQPADVVRI